MHPSLPDRTRRVPRDAYDMAVSIIVTVHTLGAVFRRIDLDKKRRFGDIYSMSLTITEEIIARQPPEAQAIIRLLLAKIAELESRIERLEGGRKTPKNSSLPPSSQHPHARSQPGKRKIQEENAAGSPATRNKSGP